MCAFVVLGFPLFFFWWQSTKFFIWKVAVREFFLYFFLPDLLPLKVIEHKPYDQKADVFSFGVVLWELLTAKVFHSMRFSNYCSFSFVYIIGLLIFSCFSWQIPYEYLTPLQAAIGVVQKVILFVDKINHQTIILLLQLLFWKHQIS